MLTYIFIYNVIHIKADFTRLKAKAGNQRFILIGSQYCINNLNATDRGAFEEVHQISRDFHEIKYEEIKYLMRQFVEEYGADNIRILTNDDSAQIGCARLREIYGIPGNTVEQLLPFVNKVDSKKRLENAVRMPKFIEFDNDEYASDGINYLNKIEANLKFPMFSKPVDLACSIETNRIDHWDHLKKIADRIAGHPYGFEIDEYIDGDLLHCDAMIINGAIQFFTAGKCSFALARFFDGKPAGSIPINDPTMFNDLQNFCEAIFKKLKCHDGAYHLEAFLEKQTQELVFLKIGARTGASLLTRVYEKIFDMNIEETNYLIQMGLIDHVQVSTKDMYAGFLNFPNLKGTVKAILAPEIEIDHEFMEFVRVGDELDQAKSLLDISCSIVFSDKSYQKVEETFEYLKKFEPLVLESANKTKLGG